jgi:hypothetical protein
MDFGKSCFQQPAYGSPDDRVGYQALFDPIDSEIGGTLHGSILKWLMDKGSGRRCIPSDTHRDADRIHVAAKKISAMRRIACLLSIPRLPGAAGLRR